ncbi:MAG: porin family protein [Bacteroidota bacterium]|nr:porin family protein [Bacteroidota bacterium]MDP4216732.1 porin family protein [Bacteroidota bacterium]MDP4247485.1 porin family protein [Bacteroidota bacterium]MDP4259262.1 porin family protein [Bacteroidota bacterium]
MNTRAVALSLVLFSFAAVNTQAQGVHLGIKAGANLFKVNGQSFDQGFQFGYNAGAFAELNFSSRWGIQPEVMFNQTNYRTGAKFSDVFPEGPNDFKGKLNYLSMPILLSYRPIKLISLMAGPQFGILMSGDQTLLQNGQSAFKKGDFSMIGGVQLNLMALKLGARYAVGLNDINDLGNSQTWKNQGWQIYAGFRIF